jgi:hypothetical protein
MARDSSLALRKAVVARLRQDSALLALVPADRIYGAVVTNTDPIRPFIRYGTSTKLPERASCMDGLRVLMTIHGFSDAYSEDEAAQIGAAIAAALDGEDGKGLVLPLAGEYSATATIVYTGGQTLPDAEDPTAWHEVVNFEATVAS